MTLATRALIRKTILSLACLAIGVTYLFPYIWMVLTGFRSAAFERASSSRQRWPAGRRAWRQRFGGHANSTVVR
jgi:ABC-type glycerol-3-phosphate transport system permease component